jgi:hypothetical protein
MRRAKQSDEPNGRPSRLLLVGLVAIPLLLVLILAVIPQQRPSDGTADTTRVSEPETSETPRTTIGARAEVIERLHTIFRVRDRAIQTRTSSLLNGIYTVDCPCLRGDRALINRLRKEGLVWNGVTVSLVVEDVQRVNDRLWIVTALVKTSPFEIQNESGEKVREVPPGEEHSRFALAKPQGQEEWLLGQASVITGRD